MREEKHAVNAKLKRMSFTEFLQHLATLHGWRAVASAVLSFIGLNLLPVAEFLAVGIFLVGCDWITGITASHKRGEKITSRKLGRTVQKIIFYSLAIVLVLIVEKTYFKTDYLVYLVSAFISLVELKSNLENISSITGINIAGVVMGAIKTRFKIKEK
jgi:hypothetical protein